MNRYLFGEIVEASKPLTVDEAREICRRAHMARLKMNSYPQDKVLALLERVKKIWENPESPFRQKAMAVLPEATGFSRPMLELGMQELVWSLDAEILRKKISVEFGGVPLVYGEKYNRKSKTGLRYYPLGTILHVLSGNVFLVGPGSLIEGLITGNVNILKMPSEERFFLPLFLESLRECDEEGVVARSIAAVDFSSSQIDVIEVFKNQMDGLVIWGGESAVNAYRNSLPARTRVIVFGPKLSFSAVTRRGVETLGIASVARAIANEVVIWDQQACTAPQACYVEGEDTARALLEAMPDAIRNVQKRFPPGAPSADAAVEIRKLRGVAEVREALGEGALVDSGSDNLDFTFVLDRQMDLEPSPLNRTLRFVPYQSLAQVLHAIEGVRGYLQTVGLAAEAREWNEITAEFSQAGALRVLPLGTMAGGEIDDPHDGLYDLPQYMNMTVIRCRDFGKGLVPFDFYSPKERTQIQSAKFRTLARFARRAPFYEERLRGVELESIADLGAIPLLTRADWEANMPPKNAVMETGPILGGYVTRSGGSTGSPKFSVFDDRDWRAMLVSAVHMFEACGFRETDRIANFMSVGDLYGSFISFNHVNFELGAQSFCFAQATDPLNFLTIARQFRINAIQGIPGTLLKFLRGVHQLDSNFKIEKLMYAGMPLGTSDREWLRTVMGVTTLVSVIGTTEANQIGYQCGHLEGTHHHLLEDYNFIEIVDETGQSLPDGTKGRLAITNLEKFNYPLLRYLNGDAGRIVEHRCECGRTGRVLEYLGRCDNLISFANMNVDYNDVVAALQDFGLSQLQLITSYRGNREHLLLVVESERSLLESDVVRRLGERLVDFAELLQAGIFTVEVQIVPPGSVALNPRTGKITGIIDERQKTLASN
jgi:phenylacetate-coenzyme A ligase PaaK-like adenylate-forming protein